MGSCMSSASSDGPSTDPGAKARNDAIDTTLKKQKIAMRNEIKMLLLGAGESGKSTVLKQMKLINQGSYTDLERESYKEIIISNTLQSIRVIVEALPNLDPPLPLNPASVPHSQTILDLPSTDLSNLASAPGAEHLDVSVLPAPLLTALQALWSDESVKKAAKERSNEMQLNDSAVYYFDMLAKMGTKEWVPSDEDILRSRVKTTGINEVVFQIGELTYKVFDVGGQRSERKKWIHCFENVTALVFLVALSEYDQVLYEDESVNRMQEALTLFDSICNSRWFVKTSIILFLNKIDLFRAKLLSSVSENKPGGTLSDFFPDFEPPVDGGSDGIYDAGCDYLCKKFLALNQNRAKTVYAHYTCATDINQIKFVLSAVQDILLHGHLQECGLL
ncbi:heterotrimeric G-protein alpha subunit, GPA1-like protein [Flagelloscypha sp. PMI_526]|nr:heterotrimeric G-protein alpha subunit, GPA1-like protein [Flagelloscypha sp. PMI_526]